MCDAANILLWSGVGSQEAEYSTDTHLVEPEPAVPGFESLRTSSTLAMDLVVDMNLELESGLDPGPQQ